MSIYKRFTKGEIPFPGARFYDFLARKSPYFKYLYEEVATDVSNEIKSGRILDVGTGPGYLPIEIVRMLPDVEVVGIDLSEDMVKIARRNAEKANVNRIRYEVEDASKMSFADSSFDFVVSTGSLHHWERKIEVFNEIYRVLKHGGQAWVYDLRKDAQRESVEKLRERYGSLVSLIYEWVRFHSSMRLDEVQNILNKPENKFKKYEIEQILVFLKIRLYKT
jgi:ubiquinone/menaquinone biosynthesis C-methylase UbiE